MIGGSAHPDPGRVRAEVEAMTDAYVAALLERVPREQIVGLYAKGSAYKPWDGPLDYVPELSDLDVHVHVREPGRLEADIGGLRGALALQACAERLYFGRFPEPVHVPRPQLVVLNALLDQPRYVPSVASTVRVLLGAPYPSATGLDAASIRRIDADSLVEHAGYVARLPWAVVDTPAKFLWGRLRELAWRVSPTASRALSVLGLPYAEAWGSNRTTAVRRLEALGEPALAAAFAGFYAAAWEFFSSRYADGEAARRAVLAGAEALERGVGLGRAALASRGDDSRDE